MKGGIGDLMKQAREMQTNLQRAQDEIAALEVTGEAGAGMVRVVMTGRHDVRRVHIDPAISGDDREMLEDLIAAAVNDAVHKVESLSRERLSGLTAGFDLPPGLKLPL